MFRAVDLVLINKLDLLPHLDFDLAAFREILAKINPDADVIEVSARSGSGIERWIQWIDTARQIKPSGA